MNLIVKVSLVALMVAVSGVLFLTGNALAHHYEFRGEEQKRRDQDHANFISKRWALSSGNLRWKADSQIRSNVEDAIEEWEDEIDELGWTRVSSNWDIEFIYEDCRGMHASYDVTDWDYDRTREARYWEEAEICIDSNFDWEGDGQLSAIAHEIGHAYGLHERYIDNRGAARCSSERTIMDTFRPNSGGRHCDGLTGPASNDVDRVEEIFEEGELNESSTSLRRTTLKFAWEDEA